MKWLVTRVCPVAIGSVFAADVRPESKRAKSPRARRMGYRPTGIGHKNFNTASVASLGFSSSTQ